MRNIDTIESDLTAPDFARRQHETYRRLREASPVFWSKASAGWIVTTFDLVDEVLTDPARFTSVGAELAHIDAAPGETEEVRTHFASPQLNISDPPDHTRIRRAFGRSFLPREVAGYRDSFRSLARELLEGSSSEAEFDLVNSYAEPLPVQVVAEVMGVPGSLRDLVPDVTLGQRHFFGESPPGERVVDEFSASLTEWRNQLRALLAERLKDPKGDVISRAAQAVTDGKITLDEAIATCLHLIIAGNGTTTALISNTLHLLLTHRDQLETVASDPNLIPNAVEESLRFEAPLPRDRRIATVDTELGGHQIKAGDRVYAVLASANRDPAQFDRPDTFDVTREFTANQHAAFGRGIHFCLGAPVARLETQVAIEVLLEVVPDLELVPGFAPEWHRITTHRALVRLPITTNLVPA